MILLPASFVFENLLKININSFLAEFTGVTKETWKNQREGKHDFKPGTFNKICDNTNSLAKENNLEYSSDVREIFHEIFKSKIVLGWGQLLDGCNYATQPEVLFPHTQKIIREFEACSIRFVKLYKAEGHKKAVRYLLSLKLPTGFISEEDISFIKSTKSIEPLSKLLVLVSMKSILYFSASIDAEMKSQTENEPKIDSRFKKFFPIDNNQSVLLPIPRFLIWIQSTSGYKNQTAIINYINDQIAKKDSDARSVRKQWGRWKKGVVIPTWSKLDKITGYLFPEFDTWERRFSVAFIVLFQRIFLLFKEMINSPMYNGTDKDILDEFANYENWFTELSQTYRQYELVGAATRVVATP